MQRYLPYGLIWVIGVPFLIWVAVAPNVTDQRFWQVDAATVKMGSSEIVNAPEQPQNVPGTSTAPDAAAPAAPAATATAPLTVSEWPDDGIKIKAISPDLQEQGTHGPVPKIGPDGSKSWQYYARPFPLDNTLPRLAIVVRDMGLSDGGTAEAIKDLPGEISFAFSPYADNLKQKMQAAQGRGHETLLQFPLEMQPGSPEDVGPRAYSSQQTPAVNQDNFNYLLSDLPGSIGVITVGGQRFVNNDKALQPLMQNLSDRGLVFVDDTMQSETMSPLLAEQIKAPWARAQLHLDDTLTSDAMDVAMGQAVQLAKQNGRALVVAGSSPLARSVIAKWAHRLQRDGVALAPLSAVVTMGSAGQTAATGPKTTNTAAPAAMTAPTELETPQSEIVPDTNSGSINLLNPQAVGGAPLPNILDPGKSAESKSNHLLSSPMPAPAPKN